MNVIETRGLTKDYGRGRGVFALDLAVKQGQVLGFLGPNGAGKTTTIRQLMGFIRTAARRKFLARTALPKRPPCRPAWAICRARSPSPTT